LEKKVILLEHHEKGKGTNFMKLEGVSAVGMHSISEIAN